MRISPGLDTHKGIAVAIACLGLVALASFTVHRRTKEIGIRKVLGATALGILGTLSTEFVLMSGLAIAIAVPATVYVLNGWLDDFTSRITIDAGLVSATLGCILLLTVGSVGYQAIRSSLIRPVEMLRDE